MKPTNEQQQICELTATGNNLLVNALAGTGKTQSGKFIAKHLPNKTCLSIFFNKKNADEGMAQADRPANMFYSTIHSLCYKQVMNAGFKSKLNKFLLFEDIDTSLLVKLLDNEEAYAKGEYQKELSKLQRIVLDCMKLWQQSDEFDCYTFVSTLYPSALGFKTGNFKTSSVEDLDLVLITDELEESKRRNLIGKTCSELWQRMTNPSDKAKITHDTYVKLFQLQGLTFREVWDVSNKMYLSIDLVILDECLTATQAVKTEQGLIRIKRLCDTFNRGLPVPKILSYNIEQGIYEYKEMLSCLTSKDREVLLIKTEGLNKVECTPNHRLLTQRGYIRADELVIGEDYLLLDTPDNQKSKYVLGEEQLQIMLGSFLGDGCLAKQSKFPTYRLQFTQGVAQERYLRSKAKAFNCPEPRKNISGYTGKESIFQTSSKIFVLDKEPFELLDLLDARGLAVWYMDDGSLGKCNSICINSNNFNYAEHIILQQLLFKNFGLQASIKNYNGFYDLRFNVIESQKLLLMVAPFMHEDLRYKNPFMKESYDWKCDFKPYGANFVSTIEDAGIQDVYDIEVADNHNFCTSRSLNNTRAGTGVIVHNCQDSNSVTLAIFNNQTHLQRIACGDKNQNLYAWRGAKNDFSSFASWNKATLTESFRFGQGIADIANKVLSLPAMETSLRLIGRGTDKGTGQTAILCRTNATVLQIVFTKLLLGEKVACVSKFNEMESMMYHVFAVLNEQEPKFPVASLKSFDTKEKMWQAIESNQELGQIYKLAKMISDAKGGLFTGLKYLEENLVSQEKADFIVSTIHASKGLGFTNVVIADDFLVPIVIEGMPYYEDAIEDLLVDRVKLAMCYVAITRAVKTVTLPWYLEGVL
jgi:hypothetical protein